MPTFARRDRKVRHLAVADYLRSTFADDGEEVMDVVARHYLDALQAVPSDADVDQIQLLADCRLGPRCRGCRTGWRSWPRGCPFWKRGGATRTRWQRRCCCPVWEQAAEAWIADTSRREGLNAAERARALHERLGDQRSAARARTLAGKGLRLEGRHCEAREHLQVALALLRPEPATDTVNALLRAGLPGGLRRWERSG